MVVALSDSGFQGETMYHPVALFLRSFNDTKASDRFQDNFRDFPANLRLVTLHDKYTNPADMHSLSWKSLLLAMLAMAILSLGAKLANERWQFSFLIGGVLAFVLRCIFFVFLELQSKKRGNFLVTDKGRLQKCADKIRAREIEGRIVKIQVSAPFWQEAILEIAKSVDVIVIDISTPGDGLMWEIETLLPLFRSRIVLFGSENRVSLAMQDDQRFRWALQDAQILLEPREWRKRLKFKVSVYHLGVLSRESGTSSLLTGWG